ncbi:MAG: serine/threonine-protein kinase [Isosphaeraceae bacterium]
MSVCQAVQHAHTKGVIHRDLKPSNVLVASYVGVPVPKVIDFGVAKASGPRPADWRTLTEHGQLIGTPLYMSPEQAEVGGQDVDTRTDIYSLGVILHELLTGAPPFDATGDVGFFELLRVIREEEPPPPSTRLATSGDLSEIAACRGTDPARLRRSVQGELDWVVTKALEKDRSRRYQTALALAADVFNVLNHGPVSACPPTVGYRLRKFVRRHRGPVLAAGMVTAALVAGIIGTTWNMLRATDALESARRSERQANERMFPALLNQARAGRFSRQMGQRHDSLARSTRRPGSGRTRASATRRSRPSPCPTSAASRPSTPRRPERSPSLTAEATGASPPWTTRAR